MKHSLLILLLSVSFFCYSQDIFVDPIKGKDSNTGSLENPVGTLDKAVEKLNSSNLPDNPTIKLLPGIYTLQHTIRIKLLNKITTTRKLILEAAIMPDDPGWEPAKMPVIVSTGGLETNFDFDCSVGLMISASHVFIGGLKFLGNPNPVSTMYYPVGREDTTLTDLEVSQCVFIGDRFSSPIQVGILTCGSSTMVNHCIFYNCRNGVVFWRVHNKAVDNCLRYCIIYGAYQSAFWTAHEDTNFEFHHNVISNCKFAWIKNYYNKASYHFNDCIISGNEYYRGVWNQPDTLIHKSSSEDLYENNIIHDGEICLIGLKTDYTGMEPTTPQHYLNICPASFGSNMGAGLFEK